MKTLTEMFKQLTHELTYEQQQQGDKHKVNSLNLRCPELDTIHWEKFLCDDWLFSGHGIKRRRIQLFHTC